MNGVLRLLIYEGYASEKITGELRSVRYLLEHLDRTRFEPLVAVPAHIEALHGTRNAPVPIEVVQPPESLRAYGGAVLRRGLFARVRTAIDVFLYARQLTRFIRERRVDVIYCCSLRAVLLIGLAAAMARRPVMFFVNGQLLNPLLDRLAFVMAQRIVFQCAANRDDRYPFLRRLFRSKFAVVPSGLDLRAIQRLQASARSAEALGIDSRQLNIIVLGLLNPEKGVDVLMRALAPHAARIPNARLWVVGDQLTADFNNYRRELEQLTRELGLTEVVRFTGWRTDALELLASMDILVHPSLSEGMPRAVLEAMALGKAVIATRVNSPRAWQ